MNRRLFAVPTSSASHLTSTGNMPPRYATLPVNKKANSPWGKSTPHGRANNQMSLLNKPKRSFLSREAKSVPFTESLLLTPRETYTRFCLTLIYHA